MRILFIGGKRMNDGVLCYRVTPLSIVPLSEAAKEYGENHQVCVSNDCGHAEECRTEHIRLYGESSETEAAS